ncbi:uncharacterized protein LOC144435572 [Glandiceps talaboti]
MNLYNLLQRRPEHHKFVFTGRKSLVYIFVTLCVSYCYTRPTRSVSPTYSYCLSKPVIEHNGSSFDCSYTKLTEIPVFLPNSTIELNLHGSSIAQLHNSSFIHLPLLKKLDLSQNRIENITAESFRNVATLEELDLSNNFISVIPCHTFRDLVNLKILRFNSEPSTSRELTEIYACSWTGLYKLERLEFSFFAFGTDQCLNFDIFTHLPSIRYLIFQISTLTCIDNVTTSGDETTENKHFNRTDNTTKLENRKEKSMKLIYLELSGNFVDHLERNDFCRFVNLKTLDLSWNFISRIYPDTFYELTNLEHLNLYHNRMTTVSSSMFTGLIHLESLHLENNYITIMNPSTFECLTNLRYLNIAYNNLSTITPGTFNGLDSLALLDLSHNNIETLQRGVFTGLSNITYLDISHNRISNIETVTFIELKTLVNLDLTFNPIQSIHPMDRSNLQYLRMGGPLTEEQASLSIIDLQTLTGLRSLELICPELKVCDNLYLFQIQSMNSSLGDWLCNHPELELFQSVFVLNRIPILEHVSTEFVQCMKLVTLPSNNTCHSIESLSLVFPPGEPIEGKTSKDMNDFFLDVLSDTPIAWLNLSAPTAWMPKCSENKSIKVETLLYNGYTETMENVFSCFDGLKALYLNNSNPPLTNVNPSSFTGLASLQILDLSANKVLEISGHTFSFLNNLVSLNLSSFLLHATHLERVLPSLPFLKVIDISYTDRETYYGVIFSSLELNLEELYVNGISDNGGSYLQSCYSPINTIFLDMSEISLFDVSTCLTHSTKYLRASGNVDTIRWDTGESESLETLDFTNTKVAFCQDVTFPHLIRMTAQLEDHQCLSKSKSKLSLSSVTRLDISYSNIPLINHKIVLLNTKNLKYVDLSHISSDFSNIDRCNSMEFHIFFQDLFAMEYLNVSYSGIPLLCQFYFSKLTYLKYLDLSHNKITSLSNDVFQYNINLTVIDLSNNLITQLNPLTNLIFRLPALSELYFENNPLICGCGMIDMQTRMTFNHTIQFTKDGSFPWQTYKCSSPNTVQGKPFLMINFRGMSCQKGFAYGLVLGPSISALVFTVIGITVWKKRWGLIYRAFRRMAKNRQYAPLDDDVQMYQYDAFVCYSDRDSEWVNETLLPRIEDLPPKLKLCIAERDFILGKYVFINIEDAITLSRKVIFLVSTNFVESTWCQFELELANQHLLDDNVDRDKLLFIILDDVPHTDMTPLLKININTKTYMKWPGGDNPRKTETFWTKLAKDLTV